MKTVMRDIGLWSVGLAWLAASLGAAPRVRPAFGIVFNDDADLAYVVPDRARSEALLRENVRALADTPVKTLVYCIGMGGDLVLYPTQVASPVGWRTSPDEKPGSLMAMRMENARVCIAQGADAVRTAGEAAKSIGLFYLPSLRMNDAHFMANPDDHAMTGEFWFKHRDAYTLKESPFAFQPAYRNLLDYSHPAVRQHRLDTALEAIERYHDLIDGFELDFNRFQVFFPKGRAAAGAPLITEMVRKVRARLDALAKTEGRPLYLFVRIPPSLADAKFAGLDVETWMEEGLVDLVSPAQIMTLAGDMPIADLLALGRRQGVKVWPSLYPRNSWRLPFPSGSGPQRYAGVVVNRESTLEEIRGAASGYFAQGVEGFYLFNFYNAFGSARPYPDALYRVFRDIARADNLRGLSKVYAVTKTFYHDGPGSYAYGKQLPARLQPGSALTLKLTVAEQPAAGPYPLQRCELRLGFRGWPAGATLTVKLNGRLVHTGEPAAAASWSTKAVTGAAPKPADAAELYVHLPLADPEGVRLGENRFDVELSAGGAATQLTDCELRYDYHHELEPLWRREPTPLN